MNHFTALVRALRYLLLAFIIFNIIGLAFPWCLVEHPLPAGVVFTRPDLTLATLTSMSANQRLLGGCVEGVDTLLLISILTLLHRMLKDITQPTLFGAKNLQRLRRIARLYLIMAIYTPFADTLVSIITSWHNPVGQRMLRIGNTNLQQIIIVLCIYVLVHLFTHAHRIETEHREVI